MTVSPEAYGAVGDGITDDFAAVQAALNSGQCVKLTEGKTYRAVINPGVTDLGLIIPQGGKLNTSRSQINLEQTGDVYGIRMQTNSHIFGNGGIAVTAATGSTNTESITQSVISLGAMNVPNLASLGPYINASRWSISGITLSTVKTNGFNIAGVGGVSNGHIHDVYFPSCSTNLGCINFDWAGLGITTSQPVATLRSMWPTSYYTVHPNNIVIERVSIGDLGNTGATAARISACHGITIRDFKINSIQNTAVIIVGGDYGYEFAQTGVLQRQGHLGNSVKNIQIVECNAASAVYVDAYADNIAAATGYTPMLNPINHSNIVIEDIRAEGNFSGTSHGIVVHYIDGATVRGCELIGFNNAVNFGDYATNCDLEENRLWGNVGDGVYVGGTISPPTDISVVGNWICNNGSGASNAGIRIANGKRPYIQHNILGGPGEGGQYYGVYVDPSVTDAFIFSNYIKAIKSGGAGISKGNTVQIAWNFFDSSIPSNRQII